MGATWCRSPLRRFHPLAVVTALLFVIGITAILLTARIENDDPYITFRYARNLAQGNGYVYNPGERVAGSTTPLFGLMLAGLFHLGFSLKAAVGLLAVLAYALIGVSAWYLMRTAGMPWGGLTLGLLLLIDPSLYTLYGNETTLALALALGAFALWQAGLYSPAMICAALLVGVRPDGVLVGGVLVLMALERWGVRERVGDEDRFRSAVRWRLWPALGWAALVLLPLYMAFVFYYETLVPHTLTVKMNQGATQVSPFWKGTLHFFCDLYWPPESGLMGILALLGTVGT